MKPVLYLALVIFLFLAAGLLVITEEGAPRFMHGLIRRARITPYAELSAGRRWIRLLVLLGGLGGLVWLLSRQERLDAAVLAFLSGLVNLDDLETGVGLALGVGILFGPPSIWGPLHRIYRVFYFLLFVVGFALVSLFFYTERIYARLPQELGGARPALLSAGETGRPAGSSAQRSWTSCSAAAAASWSGRLPLQKTAPCSSSRATRSRRSPGAASLGQMPIPVIAFSAQVTRFR
jgi:hypothetical protein